MISRKLIADRKPSAQEKLRQKLNLKKYLTELAILTGRSTLADELLGFEQTMSLRMAGKKFEAQVPACVEIPFSDRISERFKKFTHRLHDKNSSSIYVWTPRTVDCGALLVSSLMDIRWDFDSAVNKEGILAFVTNDLVDRLLLDFSEASSGEQYMRVEIQGANWALVGY